MRIGSIETSIQAIRSFCLRWKLAELSLFGSVLRDAFGPGSDVDVLIHFSSVEHMTLKGLIDMREEPALIKLLTPVMPPIPPDPMAEA